MKRAALRACLVLPLALLADRAGAQDVEMRARMSGRRLPSAYYERLARDPQAFELRDGWVRRGAMANVLQTALEGTLPIAVIPARFAGSTPVPAVAASAVLQTKLFDGPPSSTVAGYYSEVSRGKLVLRGRVAEWVTTSLSLAEVRGTTFGFGPESRIGDWLRQAVALADAQLDFTTFDNDGPDGQPNSGDDDGRVDAAAFLFAELDAACGGPGIWPHRSRVSGWGGEPAATQDIGAKGTPIVVEDYMVLGARNCTGAAPMEANVFAHETGHVFGLPDYYDFTEGLLREQRRWVVGCWDLMSAGAWGCGSGPQPVSMPPAHMGPWPKMFMRWVTSTVVPPNTRFREYVLRPVRTSGDVLQVELGPREHLLMEYRDRGGFDAVLPAAGVLAYHLEVNRAFLSCPTCPRTYSYSLLEADGNGALLRTELEGGNRGEAGDVFGTGGAITAATTPSTRLNGGALSTVSVHSITIDPTANVARVVITWATAPLIASAAPPAGRRNSAMSVAVRATGGAEPYAFTVQGTLPAGVRSTALRDQLVFSGTPTATGSFPLVLGLRDALGATTQQTVTLTVNPEAVFSGARILTALGDGGSSLSADDRSFLDQQGNRNGRFDVGDARAHLRRSATP